MKPWNSPAAHPAPGQRVWKTGSGLGPKARFGAVMTHPDNPQPAVSYHPGFSVRWDDGICEAYLDLGYVQVVSEALEWAIRHDPTSQAVRLLLARRNNSGPAAAAAPVTASLAAGPVPTSA